MPDTKLVRELAGRLVGIAIISSDITDADVGEDVEAVIARVNAYCESLNKPVLITKEVLAGMEDVTPSHITAPKVEVEVAGNVDFKPLAAEVESRFSVKCVDMGKTSGTVADFTNYFNDRLARIKATMYDGQSSKLAGMTHDIESVKQYASGREVVVSGMVYDKRITTKNGHVLVTLEDETGTAKVLFIKPQQMQGQLADLYASASRIVNDEIIAVRGKVSGPFIMASSLIYPDVPVHQRKTTEEDIAVAFMSDIHIGSKLFMQKQFDRFISWINGKVDYRRELAGKIKYVVISGDLVDGIGVYPNQDRELAIADIYLQYKQLFDMFAKVPEYVHIFMLTGNHDAVQRAEPQPQLPEEFYRDYTLSNIHLVSNPGYINAHGVKILGYHGTSLDSVIQGIPGCSYSKPEGAMLEVLKRRHLSPIYGDNPIVPAKKDPMVIDQVPDILHMGHLHKNGYAEYHGTLIVNSGTWQARTSYQMRLGHMPTPGILPVYETRQMAMSAVDFNSSGG